MARMMPELSSAQVASIESKAERKFYTWCRDFLGSNILVLHSVNWIDRDPANGAYDGECDFTVCDSRRGIVFVEVKGGGVRFDAKNGQWSTISGDGKSNVLRRSPYDQAKRSKYRLLKALQGNRAWTDSYRGMPPIVTHAVFFPDLVDVSPLLGINSPKALTGGLRDGGSNLEKWLDGVFNFAEGAGKWGTLGSAGLEIVSHTLMPEVEVRPLFVSSLEEAEHRRIKLTQEQLAILGFLDRHPRALISGGAGTGKTLLAMEKTRRLAAEGQRTLLLCYNEALAAHLVRSLESIPNATAMTLHSFCGWAVSEVRKRTGRDLVSEIVHEHPEWDLYNDVLPEALGRASEILVDRFDAIVVDEGQDFKSTYWLPLELMSRDAGAGVLYIFYDENQAFYSKSNHYPIADDPYLLSKNCRNTRPIHEAAYCYYHGAHVSASDIPGRPLSGLIAASIKSQAYLIRDEVVRLYHDEAVKPFQMVVLIAGSPKLDYVDALESAMLPHGLKWAIERPIRRNETDNDRDIVVESVRRFKGLEADIAFLWGAEDFADPSHEEVLYVGISRAKTHVYLVGNAAIGKVASAT